jgi:urease accessory protein
MTDTTVALKGTATRMMTTDDERPARMNALFRLMTWLSPAFPVGSFSYSHGLEGAVSEGLVETAPDLGAWLGQLLGHGSGWNDAVLLAESWRRAGNGGDLVELSALAEAMAASAERHMETMRQGAAFLEAASSWPHAGLERLPAQCAYPVAVGAIAGLHAVPLADALAAYLQAFVSNLAQAAIRLSVVGQKDAVSVIARLEPLVTKTALRGADSTLDDLGSATLISDIMSMKHETQHSRLFRS